MCCVVCVYRGRKRDQVGEIPDSIVVRALIFDSWKSQVSVAAFCVALGCVYVCVLRFEIMPLNQAYITIGEKKKNKEEIFCRYSRTSCWTGVIHHQLNDSYVCVIVRVCIGFSMKFDLRREMKKKKFIIHEKIRIATYYLASASYARYMGILAEWKECLKKCAASNIVCKKVWSFM